MVSSTVDHMIAKCKATFLLYSFSLDQQKMSILFLWASLFLSENVYINAFLNL